MKLRTIVEMIGGGTFYHGTSSVNLPSVRRDGIVPNQGGGADDHAIKTGGGNYGTTFRDVPDRTNSVFLSASPEAASVFAAKTVKLRGGECVVLKIELPSTRGLVPDEADGNKSFRFVGTIEPDWIKNAYRVDYENDRLVGLRS